MRDSVRSGNKLEAEAREARSLRQRMKDWKDKVSRQVKKVLVGIPEDDYRWLGELGDED